MYLAKERLDYDPQSWMSLPWWQRRMYLEGFLQDGLISEELVSQEDGHDVSLDDLAASGVQVQRQ